MTVLSYGLGDLQGLFEHLKSFHPFALCVPVNEEIQNTLSKGLEQVTGEDRLRLATDSRIGAPSSVA